MAKTIDTRHTCKDCGFFQNGFCVKTNQQTRAIMYACGRFRTMEQLAQEAAARKAELTKKEEERLNFILTGLYILSTATTQMLEYFDAQFKDRKTESNWRFKRKQAANEIDRCVQRIRDIYQHSFMQDQTQVMTNHGKEAFDAKAYDTHEDDARRWNKLLLHHMESSWQDENAEAQILSFYESLPHVGIFHHKDFNHFTTKQ